MNIGRLYCQHLLTHIKSKREKHNETEGSTQRGRQKNTYKERLTHAKTEKEKHNVTKRQSETKSEFVLLQRGMSHSLD